MEEKPERRRRVVLIPAPAQGHISPMMQLARAFHLKGFSITVAQTKSITWSLEKTQLILSLSASQRTYQPRIWRILGQFGFLLNWTKSVRLASRSVWVSCCCNNMKKRSLVSSTTSSCTLLKMQPKSLTFPMLFSVPKTQPLLLVALPCANSMQKMAWLHSKVSYLFVNKSLILLLFGVCVFFLFFWSKLKKWLYFGLNYDHIFGRRM